MAGRAAYAVGVFLVFGAIAVAMGRSAARDWRDAHGADAAMLRFWAIQQWWPTFLAAAVAIVGPAVILAG